MSRSTPILKKRSAGSGLIDVHLGQLAQQLHRPLQPQPRVGRHAEREPDVELVLALVVVGDAGVGVEDLGRCSSALGRRPRGDQHRPVAELARVEDGRDLPDDPLAAQAAHPLQHLVLAQPQRLAEPGVGTLDNRKLVLDQIAQPRVLRIHWPRRIRSPPCAPSHSLVAALCLDGGLRRGLRARPAGGLRAELRRLPPIAAGKPSPVAKAPNLYDLHPSATRCAGRSRGRARDAAKPGQGRCDVGEVVQYVEETTAR